MVIIFFNGLKIFDNIGEEARYTFFLQKKPYASDIFLLYIIKGTLFCGNLALFN